MPYRLRVLGFADGRSTPYDGQWVMHYDPAAFDGGGDLETTADTALALTFSTMGDALDFYRQQWGLRTDGKPTRPLTALNIVVEPANGNEGQP